MGECKYDQILTCENLEHYFNSLEVESSILIRIIIILKELNEKRQRKKSTGNKGVM